LLGESSVVRIETDHEGIPLAIFGSYFSSAPEKVQKCRPSASRAVEKLISKGVILSEASRSVPLRAVLGFNDESFGGCPTFARFWLTWGSSTGAQSHTC
jgi:hypothetical protein